MLFVFMSQPDFSCNPYALYEYVRDHTCHETAWIVKSNDKFKALQDRGIQCAIYDTIDGNKLIAEADYIVMNSYTFPDVPKREGQIFVNLWHGSGIKAHDYYDRNSRPRHIADLRDFCEKMDLMCVHSLDDRFKLSAQLHYDMRRSYVTGQPRLDYVKKADGRKILSKIFGEGILQYKHLIFYAPSFRANASSHSGSLVGDNIFRLSDFDMEKLDAVLAKNDAAIVYKLHPVEQTAFKGRNFSLGSRCFELTEKMLFDADVRYVELLNAFDAMISDYSSIAFDYLLLNRPIIYLIPDYEEYTSERGFVFNKIDSWMPGGKAFNFQELLTEIHEAMTEPQKHQAERELVLDFRFDYQDGSSAQRCYDTIMNFTPPNDEVIDYESNPRLHMPSQAEQLSRYLEDEAELVDSTKEYTEEEKRNLLESDRPLIYVKDEINQPYRCLSGFSSVEIADFEFYNSLKDKKNVNVVEIGGGVDFEKFHAAARPLDDDPHRRKRIGFAGTIDKRIYFAMIQYICEALPEYDIVFAGDIKGDYPVWLGGYDNLSYVEASYDELPEMIASFDVCLLPFYGRHKQYVPTELFQYLAEGKIVVASDMNKIPKSPVIFQSASISDAVNNIRLALTICRDKVWQEEAMRVAQQRDWKLLAEKLPHFGK